MIVTESWFNANISDDLICIPGYSVFRDDRCGRIGGGVAIWSRQFFSPLPFVFLHKPEDIECIAIVLPISRLLLVACYIPPIPSLTQTETINDFLITNIDRFYEDYPNYRTIVCGDFNRLDINSLCLNCNLKNCFGKPTYGDAQLDYMLIHDEISSCFTVSDFFPIDASKQPHLSLLAAPVQHESHPTCIINDVVFDLRASNVDFFLNKLAQADWAPVYNEDLSVDDKCNAFHTILNTTFDQTIPVHFVRRTQKDKPWITSKIIHLINERWRAYRTRNFAVYRHLKTKVQSEIEKSKVNWISNMSAKDLWSSVRTVMGKNKTDPLAPLLNRYKCCYLAASAINEELTQSFNSSENFELSAPTGDWPIDLEPHTIYRCLSTMPSKKSSPDLPTKLYKCAAYVISEPLSHIYKASILSQKFPSQWKIGAIVPIPKIKNPTLKDLRPISLLPIPSKVFERLVLCSLKTQLLKCFGNHQFGFKPKSSTSCALIALQNFILTVLEKDSVCAVQLVSYDFSRAFDKLKSNKILKRLQECNFSRQCLEWLESYLTGRSQYVRIGIDCSPILPVTSGVPQGSVLGPYLFAATLATLKSIRNDSFLMKYADDCTYCFPVYTQGSNEHITESHNEVVLWSTENCLPLNLRKSKSLLIASNKYAFSQVDLNGVANVDSLTLLGVTFQKGLIWKEHFDKVISTASRRLFAIRVLRKSLSNELLLKVYCGIVRSVLEYCAPLFTGISERDNNRLERIQRRFHKLLHGKQCTKVCMTSLKDRRLTLSIKLFEQAQDELHPLNEFLPRRSARSHRFILPAACTQRRLNAFIIKCSMHWNESHQR